MGQVLKKYPLYIVKANTIVALQNYAGQTFNINGGTIGTFQARQAPSLGVTNPNQPDEIIIDAKFNGQTIVFRPKDYIPNGDIKPLLLKTQHGIPSFTILKVIYPSINNNNIYSNIDSNEDFENDEAITTLNNPDDLGIYSNADANTSKRFLLQRPNKMITQKVDLVAKEIPVENAIIEDKKESASASKVASSSDEDKIFGMPKNVAYGAGLALVIIGGFFIYKKFIKK